MFKRLKLKLLYKFVGLKKEMDSEEEQEFLAALWENKGFQSYLYVRDLTLLKDLGSDLEYKDYIYYMGRRKELLKLAAESKKAWLIKYSSENDPELK